MVIHNAARASPNLRLTLGKRTQGLVGLRDLACRMGIHLDRYRPLASSSL